MQTTITPQRVQELLAPLLESLPAATVSAQPPIGLLPLLSPILRQRVQLLSASTEEPWLPLLCYNPANTAKLEKAVKTEKLNPHPVSGEVEIDWEGEVSVKYKRVDEETLQASVVLQYLGVTVKLIWCIGDDVGGGDGWRIGEVGVLDGTESDWGLGSISGAEAAFVRNTRHTPAQTYNNTSGSNSLLTPDSNQDEDDDYWAQYDNTPAQTPAPKHSPNPPTTSTHNPAFGSTTQTEDDSYYEQYASVQPALDNHDPDEEPHTSNIESSLGGDELQNHLSSYSPPEHELTPSTLAWSEHHPTGTSTANHPQPYTNGLLQPRPGSSSSSSGSDTVARLEREAAARDQSEMAIKQHISTSVKSLYRLAKTAGIERTEFVRLIGTELECLELMDEDD